MKKRLFLCVAVLSLAALIGVVRAALLGVTVIPPIIGFTSTSLTSTTYNPVTEIFSVVTTPSTILFSTNGPSLSISVPRSMTIKVLVDNTGALVGSAGPGPDLVISGKVTQIVGTTTNVYSGLLLTGEVQPGGFGYAHPGGSVGDFDLRFTPTGGALEQFYTCDHIGVTLNSEASTFTGSFTTNFQGEAKGNVGLEDLIPPSVTCPTNIILQCNASSGGQGGAYYTYPPPVGSDNCTAYTNLTFVYTPPSGSFFVLPYNEEIANSNVTLTVIDASGNSNSCSFTVTVEDTVPPVLDVADPIIGECEEAPFVLTNAPGQCYAPFTFEIPTAFDQCCTNNLVVTVSAVDQSNTVILLTNNGDGTMSGNFPVTCPGGTNVITSVAVDDHNNSSSATCEVLVVDEMIPVIQNCSNQVFECTANTPAGGAVNFLEPTAFDWCPNLTISCIPTNGSVLPLGTNVIVYTVSDFCSGLTNSCAFDVIVQDTTPPTISCPANVTATCSQSTNPGITGTATATDTCDPNPKVTYTDTAGPVNCTGLAGITRTWTATDASGNSATCVQSITYTNTTAPTVTVPTGSNLGCNPATLPTVASVTALVTASETCGTPTINVSSVDTTNGCTITRTFTVTATDGCGNTSAPQTVVYSWTADTTAPVVTVPASQNLGCNPATLPTCASVKALVTATDACSTPTINVTNVLSGTACAMTDTFTVTATDACGNTSAPQTVVYTWTVDTTAPVVTVPASQNLGCNPATLPSVASVKALVTATATCGTPTINVSSVLGGTACAMIDTFTVTATDACGNTSAPQTVVYTWTVDTTAPVVTVPAGGSLGCNPASLPSVASVKALVTATAACGTPTINITSATSGSPCAMTLTFTVTATDACGLTSAPQTVVYTYTVDTTAPSITCPAAVTVQCASSVPAANVASVTASATCGTPTVTWVGDVITNKTCPNRYTVLRTYKAVDPCGNSATCTQTITVNDTTAPSITCPTNITVVTSSFCTNTVPASNAAIVAFLQGVTASDNCGSGATVTNNAPSNFSLGTNTVTFTATDSCGNSSSCQASVIVVTVPVTCHPITCAPSFCQHHFDNFGNCQFAEFEGNITLSDGDQPCDFRTSSNSYYSVKVTIGTNVVYCKSLVLCDVGNDGCGGEAWEYFGNNNYEQSICRFTDNQCYNACMDPNMPSSKATGNKNCGELSTVNIGATSTRFFYAFGNASQPITVVCDGVPICSVSNNVATSTFPFSQSGTTIQCTFPDRLVPGNTLQWYACGNASAVSSNCLLYTQQTCASNNATATYFNEGGVFNFQCPTIGCHVNDTNRTVCVTVMIGQPGVTTKVGCTTFCQTLSGLGNQDWEFGQCSQFQDEYNQCSDDNW
jgi:hypothetical protein